MNPAYLPKTMKAKVGRVTEEIGEVLQTIGKIERFGLDTRWNPETHKVENQNSSVESNRQALMRELDDLKHAIGEAQVAVRLAPADFSNPFDSAPVAKDPPRYPQAPYSGTGFDDPPRLAGFSDPDSRLGHYDNACEQDEGA